MEGFRDPTRLARIGAVALYIYMGVDALSALLGLPALLGETGPADPVPPAIAAAVAILEFVCFVACVVLVGRWTYVTNANAHLFTDGMTISPGWAVGWYFIPLANLFKPYQAMKETWLASHYGGDWGSGEEPVELRWWWLLWIVTSILGNVSFRMERAGAAPSTVAIVDLIGAALNVGLCLVLIRLMQRLAATQVAMTHAETFA